MPKRLRWRFTFAISPRFNSRRWNLQELCSVRRSTGWQSLVSYGKSHVTNDALKTASQNAKFQYDPKERTPPRFSPPVSRFRTPAHFWCEMVTYQIWRETVKTRGASLENVFVGLFHLFPEMLVCQTIDGTHHLHNVNYQWSHVFIL